MLCHAWVVYIFCLICLMLIIRNTGFSYDIFIHVHNIFWSHSPSIALLSLFYSSLSSHLALLLLCVCKKDLVNVTKTVYRNMGTLPVSVLLKKKSFPLPSAVNCFRSIGRVEWAPPILWQGVEKPVLMWMYTCNQHVHTHYFLWLLHSFLPFFYSSS